MADDVRRAHALGVENGRGVVGHSIDGNDGLDRLAPAHAAVIERDAGEVGRQLFDLRQPAVALHADALDEQHRRAVAANHVVQVTTLARDDSHGISCPRESTRTARRSRPRIATAATLRPYEAPTTATSVH
jgi:hypothetical protein